MKHLNENFGGGYETPTVNLLSIRFEEGFCVSGVNANRIDDIVDDEDVINF